MARKLDNNSSPSISIIIPTLNEERYLPSLLESLTHQTSHDFEVIVVDGNSKDRTIAIARRFSKRLRIRIFKSSSGTSIQRNLGAEKSHCERLIFIDADCVVSADFIEKLVQNDEFRCLENIIIPKYIPSNKRLKFRFIFGIINLVLMLFRHIKPSGIGMCIISSKKIHQRIDGFDTKIDFADDLDYVNRASRDSDLYILGLELTGSTRRFEREGTKYTIIRWMMAYCCFLVGQTSRSNSIRYFTQDRDKTIDS